MRTLFLLILVLGGLWVFDGYFLDGRYSAAVWQQANSQGQKLKGEVDRLVKKAIP